MRRRSAGVSEGRSLRVESPWCQARLPVNAPVARTLADVRRGITIVICSSPSITEIAGVGKRIGRLDEGRVDDLGTAIRSVRRRGPVLAEPTLPGN